MQGWHPREYELCVDLYARHGVDLARQPLLDVGSVCRRQGSAEAERIVSLLNNLGLNRLHLYGSKTLGLARFAPRIESSDSMAWSFAARYQPRLRSCLHLGHCGNCRRYALRWRSRLPASLAAQRADATVS
ncbi:hypothetical protein Cs7R123_32020 [Catellatospora sp. TT07R-123]|uniref:deazapurine DNA modification protein DpdA family protein n=1 Tax=Catellatospora sp. TT07R-123 TaxID=2733863 RepID=UPI001B1E3474|nr:hypothetical protein [Catellatospora sp. TT07R-123]GHJ45860.1 hypothetical protein Cs7R123_32020 [Catellatospora sp. TT07R-123]